MFRKVTLKGKLFSLIAGFIIVILQQTLLASSNYEGWDRRDT